MRRTRTILFFAGLLVPCAAAAQALPGAYFPLLEAGAGKVEQRLNAEPAADLLTLEARGASRHFPYAILPPAVLYAKQHPRNGRYHDPRMLALAIRIGDLLAAASEKGVFEPRLDSDWDTYMWLETYRLLEQGLGAERAARWKREILKNVEVVEPDLRERIDFPSYSSTFMGTSPNHYSLWAANVLLVGRVFGNRAWEDLAAKALHRFAAGEQTEDGYWGENTRRGPATGYNHLTLSAVALYSEYHDDPAALTALRRATDFHENFTFLDGMTADVINDRNRKWGVSAWSHFAFSRFPDGRRYAEFLTGFFHPDDLSYDAMGRLAQDALYYHEGPVAPMPLDQDRGFYRMHVPAGMRKSGPWQVCLSGILDSAPINNPFILDRQGSVSVFHRTLGLIITGANSKRQPELATFTEKVNGQLVYMPLNTVLVMNERSDRLSAAFHTFFSELEIAEPAEKEVALRFVITGKYEPSPDARLNLQLCLKPGEVLETGAGRKFTIGAERIELDGGALGGLIRHHGWSMKVDPKAHLEWPVYPFNPYASGPETSLNAAVARLWVPLDLKAVPGKKLRVREREIVFALSEP